MKHTLAFSLNNASNGAERSRQSQFCLRAKRSLLVARKLENGQSENASAGKRWSETTTRDKEDWEPRSPRDQFQAGQRETAEN